MSQTLPIFPTVLRGEEEEVTGDHYRYIDLSWPSFGDCAQCYFYAGKEISLLLKAGRKQQCSTIRKHARTPVVPHFFLMSVSYYREPQEGSKWQLLQKMKTIFLISSPIKWCDAEWRATITCLWCWLSQETSFPKEKGELPLKHTDWPTALRQIHQNILLCFEDAFNIG